jgi:hypothetical protein
LRAERFVKAVTKHHKSSSRTYAVWRALKQRCTNPKNKGFNNYGGRGITLCSSWHDFSNFLKDMGEAPPGRCIERLDNNKGYYRENCAWKTYTDQNRNKRDNRILRHKGKAMCLSQWSEETGLKSITILHRIDYLGWNVGKALSTPAAPWGR